MDYHYHPFSVENSILAHAHALPCLCLIMHACMHACSLAFLLYLDQLIDKYFFVELLIRIMVRVMKFEPSMNNMRIWTTYAEAAGLFIVTQS